MIWHNRSPTEELAAPWNIYYRKRTSLNPGLHNTTTTATATISRVGPETTATSHPTVHVPPGRPRPSDTAHKHLQRPHRKKYTEYFVYIPHPTTINRPIQSTFCLPTSFSVVQCFPLSTAAAFNTDRLSTQQQLQLQLNCGESSFICCMGCN